MKKVIVLALVVAAVLCAGFVFAQGLEQGNPPPPPQEGQMKDMSMDKKSGPMMSMNMMGMMPKQMVSTNDGGVIILAGSKLLKYDKDLNLVKEVEIKAVAELKIDPTSVQEMINKMKEKYGKSKDKSEPAPVAQSEIK